MTGYDTHSLFEHRVSEVRVVRATATTDCLVAGYDVGFREASVRLRVRLRVVKPDASLHITQHPCKQTTQDTRSVSKQTTSIKYIRKTGMQFP